MKDTISHQGYIDHNSNEGDENNTSSTETKQINQIFNTKKISNDHDNINRNKCSHNTNYNGQEYIDTLASIGMLIPSEKGGGHDENSRHNSSISRSFFVFITYVLLDEFMCFT
jgi:hypothetical protein